MSDSPPEPTGPSGNDTSARFARSTLFGTSVLPTESLVYATLTITIDPSPVQVPTSFARISTTLKDPGEPLLTSTCTDVYFAQLEDTAGNRLRYLQFGCSKERPNCCPYGFGEGVALERCMDDYTMQVVGSYTACCPNVAKLGSFTLFSSAIGMIPCASKLSDTVYVPATTNTDPSLRMNTGDMFAASFPMGKQHSTRPQTVKIAVGVVAGVLGLLVIAFLVLYLRKRGAKKAGDHRDPVYELPKNSNTGVNSPEQNQSPPNSEAMQQPDQGPLPAQVQPPQELPATEVVRIPPSSTAQVESDMALVPPPLFMKVIT